jgi:chorismate synthase
MVGQRGRRRSLPPSPAEAARTIGKPRPAVKPVMAAEKTGFALLNSSQRPIFTAFGPRDAAMAGNSFGTLFRFTTWGESHGPAIGVVVDGVPPRLPLGEADIQHWLDRRRPGQSRYTTQRQEPDQVKILSGVFDGQTTGAPIQLLIDNVDQRSKDYRNIADRFRPGHADYTYWKKYGIRDYRGGGRASARETASRVAAGAVARKVLGPTITVRGALVQIGPHPIDRGRWDWRETENNPFWCPDAATAARWADYLDGVRKSGSSAGAVIEIVASGAPAGLGEPVYDKLDGDLARALMTINAVKGVEIGAGFATAALSGEQNGDEMRMQDGEVVFLSNNAGGILGGISTGQDIIGRFVVKPTSSILKPMRTVDTEGNEVEIETHGRHDPCVGIRAVPVGEAMVACVLADHLLRHRALTGG